MTIASQISKAAFAGNGSSRDFPVPFRFIGNADVEVILRDAAGTETLLAETTHYALSGAGSAEGGDCRLLAAPGPGETLVLRRAPRIVQEVDYQENDAFPAESHEAALDLLTMICQALDERIGRAPLLRVSSGTPAVALDDPAPGRSLVWSPDGTALQAGPAAEDILRAQESAAQAAAARDRVQDLADGLLAPRAADLAYDNGASGLAADSAQAALDELAARPSGSDAGLRNLLLAEALRRAVGDSENGREFLGDGWIDPLADADDVTLSGNLAFTAGDGGCIETAAAGSDLAVSWTFAADACTHEDLKGAVAAFTVDTADASGHFDAARPARVLAGCRMRIGGVDYPIASIGGDGTAPDAVAFSGTLVAGTYALQGIHGTQVGGGKASLAGTAAHPAGLYYPLLLPALEAADWTALKALAATQALNGQEIDYAVSFDGGATFSVWTGAAWKGIVRDNAGTWQYWDGAAWQEASADSLFGAAIQALGLAGNRMSGTTAYGTALIDRTLGTASVFGGTASYGGVAAAFDGVTGQANTACLMINYNAAAENVARHVGKDWGAGVARTVASARIYGSSDLGLYYASTSVTATLQGSADGSEWTDLGTTTQADAAGVLIEVAATVLAPFRFHRLRLVGNSSEVHYLAVAECQFYERVLATPGLDLLDQAAFAATGGFGADRTAFQALVALKTTDAARTPELSALTATVNTLTGEGEALFAAFEAAAPDRAKVVLVLEAVDAVTLDEDLRAFVRRGDGDFTPVPLAVDSPYDAARLLVAGDADLSSGSGTATRLRLAFANHKRLKVYAAGNTFRAVG